MTVTGRIVARGLADEARDRHYLVVDAIDGRAHYVDIGKAERTEPLPDQSIIRITPREPRAREVDQRIAAIAARQGGRYSVDRHRFCEPDASIEFADAHVRRLEAVRRITGNLKRDEFGSWSIPPDYLELAKRYEALRAREAPVDIQILSPLPLERLAGHDGATWIDRELISPEALLRNQGFGREVRSGSGNAARMACRTGPGCNR